MNSELKKVWGLFLTTEFILAQVIDGAWGVLLVWITFLFWEIWYLMVLDGVRVKAEKYYNEIVGRFKLSVGLIMAIETVFSVMSVVILWKLITIMIIKQQEFLRFLYRITSLLLRKGYFADFIFKKSFHRTS